MEGNHALAVGLVCGSIANMAATESLLSEVHPVVVNGNYTEQFTFMLNNEQFVVSVSRARDLT